METLKLTLESYTTLGEIPMSFSPSSPVTGAPQTGFTSPTYTLTSDTPPNAHSVQYAVTAVGGTQTGVDTHTVSDPFTLTLERPANFRMLGVPNPVTGVINNVPMNIYKLRTRKGATPADGQPSKTIICETFIKVPAGVDEFDAEQVRAAISCHGGVLWESSDDIGDSCINGVI